MTQNPFLKVTYGEVRLIAEDSLPTSPPTPWYFRVQGALSGFFTLFTRLAVVVSIVALLAVTWQEVFGRPVVLEPIGIPGTLEKMGFSQEVAAQRLWDAVFEINAQVETVKGHTSFVAQARQLEVTEPGTGFSIRGLVDFIRAFLNIDQIRVAGEFLCGDTDCSTEKMELRVRVFDGDRMKIARMEPLGGISSKQDIDRYFLAAGKEVLRLVDPYIVSMYLVDLAEPDESMKVVQEMIDTDHPDLPWAYLQEGRLLSEFGHHSKAVASYQKALLLAPRNVVALANLGKSLGDLSRHSDAQAAYREALRLDPRFAVAHIGLAEVLGAADLHEDAILSYRQALELDASLAFAHIGLGNSQSALGRHLSAISSFLRAIELDPQNAVAHNNLGLARETVGQFDRAVASYQRAIELDPEFTIALRNLGVLLNDLNRPSEAIPVYVKALSNNNRDPVARVGLGISLSALGLHEEASDSYRKALELDPQDTVAHDLLGLSQQALGQLEDATESFETALQLDSRYVLALRNWTVLLRQTDSRTPEECDAHLSRLKRFDAFVTARGEPERMEEFRGEFVTCALAAN